MHDKVGIERYAAGLKALQFAVFSLPLVSRFLEKKSALPFPPMGDDPSLWKFLALAIAGVAAFLPYFVPDHLRKKWLAVLAGVLFLVSVFVFTNCYDEYVYAIERTDKPTFFVIRGSERNPDLREPYASMTDHDLLKWAGPSDQFLEDAYTRESLHHNRRLVFWSYSFVLFALEGTLGLMVAVGGKATEEHSS